MIRTKTKGKDEKGKPGRRALAAAAVLAATTFGGCGDWIVNNIPYVADSGADGGAGACLENENVVQQVGACEVASSESMVAGDVLVLGETSGIKLSTFVDVDLTKGAYVDAIDAEQECASVDNDTLLSGEVGVMSINGEGYSVSVGTIEYGPDGLRATMTVTPDCYQESDGGAGGAGGDGGAGQD